MGMIRSVPRLVELACDLLFELSARSWFFHSPNTLNFFKPFTYIILPDTHINPMRRMG